MISTFDTGANKGFANLPDVELAGRFHPRTWVPGKEDQPSMNLERTPLAMAHSQALFHLPRQPYRHFSAMEVYRRHAWRVHWLDRGGSSPWADNEDKSGEDLEQYQERSLRLAYCCVPPFWSVPSGKFWRCTHVPFCPFCWSRFRVEMVFKRLYNMSREYRSGLALVCAARTDGVSSPEEIHEDLLPRLRLEELPKAAPEAIGRYQLHYAVPGAPGEDFWQIFTRVLYVFPGASISKPIKNSSMTFRWFPAPNPHLVLFEQAKRLGQFLSYPFELWYMNFKDWGRVYKELPRRRRWTSFAGELLKYDAHNYDIS